MTFVLMSVCLPAQQGLAQSLGSAGTIQGTVTDASGAVLPGATIEIQNPVTGYQNSSIADATGRFSMVNVPFNKYHLTAAAPGFAAQEQDLELRSSVPVNLTFKLPVATAQTTVTVEASGADLVETSPAAHTDISSNLIAKLPLQSNNSALSSVVSVSVPGIANDSNGLFHPLGEHADTSFVVDNQPITDQQSRVFSNQISLNTIESMEAITGVAPAEFGDKASLVVRTTTKSGLGLARPRGDITTSYGSFGTSTLSGDLGFGGQKMGNYFAVDGINSGRFLDTPEFQPLHAKGNAQNVFDRFDYQLSESDSLHLNVSGARSWFQSPNDFDQQAAGQDQRQLQRSFNIAPGYTHQFSPTTLLTANAYIRQDRIGYYPSSDPFFDQPATLRQQRRLTNAGIKTDVAYVQGIHEFKAGVQFYHTFLSEFFQTGLTDPLFNSVCVDSSGGAVIAPGVEDPANCGRAGFSANPDFQAGLLPFDLSRGGQLFDFQGKTDIKQEAVYVQDSLKLGKVVVNVGLRGDNYNGLSSRRGIEPRVGLSYSTKTTGTVLRASYGRFFLTPYNENLVLSSSTGQGGLATGVFGAFAATPLIPGRRNHFEMGLQQAFGRHLVVDASYFWKFTQDDFDFDVILNTPLAFPIQWRKSKIDGVSVRVNLPATHGITAYSVMGHTRARFFGPEIGGILFNSPVDASVFRIDHDQAFQQSTHIQYQPGPKLPWIGMTWSYESGQVAGAVPDFATALTFTADQQAQIGLFCGNQFATPTSPITRCSAPNFGATRVRIPAAGTENDDRNPPRIAPRNQLDASVGMDNLFNADRRKVSLRLTAVNLTNKVALYNFLSTFSGTHFLTPRAFTAELGFHF
jgi:hypothetical protein